MSLGVSLTLTQLIARLSPTLLLADEDPRDTSEITTFSLFDPARPVPEPPGSLVLGTGTRDQADVRLLMETASAATAVVLRDSFARDEQIIAAVGGRLPVLRLRDEASWSQLTTTLAVIFGLATETPDSIAFGDAETDLFTLANSVADLVGGPTTIEDLSSRILAFSADQAAADEARRQSVLGHQVPDMYNDVLRSTGMFNTIYQSPAPVYLDDLPPGVRPRVAMRLQAGGELLGSVWIVLDEPLSTARQQGLIEAANIIALTMLRMRVTRDTTSRLRTERMLALLDGGAAALETAGTARLPLNHLAVLALSLPTRESGATGGDEHDTEFDLQRVTSSLAMHLQSAYVNAPVALLGHVVYAVLPLDSDRTDRAKEVVADFLARLTVTPVLYAGLGDPVDASDLPVSRRGADQVLRVLRHRHPDQSTVATTEDTLVHSLLLRLSDQVEHRESLLSRPLRTLLAYDEKHGTELVRTLSAWLDHFCDVTAAADSVYVHKNTFRYRLHRLSELANIDLDDTEQRFSLMLQLRLRELSAE